MYKMNLKNDFVDIQEKNYGSVENKYDHKFK